LDYAENLTILSIHLNVGVLRVLGSWYLVENRQPLSAVLMLRYRAAA
jgi:hypothetical protein